MSAGAGSTESGKGLAVLAEALYLANLLLAPGLAFLALLWLFARYRDHASPLARCHLRQTLVASLWAGALLVLANILIIATGGYRSAATWVIVILYFTVCHSALVVLGALGLAKAMAEKAFRYPLIGVACD